MRTRRGVFRDDLIHVMEEKCATCIYRGGNLMSLKPGAVKHLTDKATANDGCIHCHETLHDRQDGKAVCRGFYDLKSTRTLQLATMLGAVKFVS